MVIEVLEGKKRRRIELGVNDEYIVQAGTWHAIVNPSDVDVWPGTRMVSRGEGGRTEFLHPSFGRS